ncbi:MAG: sulfurtransferase TusA family protein [Planctomycetes bacterium]|nr:sulfurtransferase TusA family protein [Planctomycetota bacterium]
MRQARQALRRFDFRGVKCPINFVRTKIELEKVAVGDVIVIRIDAGEPLENVPRSLRLEGQEVLSQVENDDGTWTLEVQRNR